MRQLLEDYNEAQPPSADLESALVDELNRLLQEADLYEETRFAHLPLSPETWPLRERSASGPGRLRFQRWLLEEAYPGEVAPRLHEAHKLTSRQLWQTGAAEEEELWWRLLLLGIVGAALTLTHYLMGTVALVLGVYVLVSQPRKGRALGWFALGFLLPLLPWMGRNFHLVGSPFQLVLVRIAGRHRHLPRGKPSGG